MIKISNVKLNVEFDFNNINKVIAEKLRIKESQVNKVMLVKKSIDAREKKVKFVCSFLVVVEDEQIVLKNINDNDVTLFNELTYEHLCLKEGVLKKPPISPIVVGAGPAGLFAGYILAKAGLAPVIVEQGQSVENRVKIVDNFWKNAKLDEQTNVQFGEGGAGAFSDGKLNTGINDFRCRFVLNKFHECGAEEDILYSAKPHIGTDRLIKIVKNLREQIISLGGKIMFLAKLKDIEVANGKVESVSVLQNDELKNIKTNHVILAIGHSARDTFKLVKDAGCNMTQKDFSIGVRIEHLQKDINLCQYGDASLSEKLGASDYKLACHLKNGRGVYTFCMCPGGKVVNSSSEEGHLVTNGMSLLARNCENANSALLVSVSKNDFNSDDVLAGVEFQRKYEKMAFDIAKNYTAPAQLVGDFLCGKTSNKLGNVQPSFLPNVTLSSVEQCLPRFAIESLKQGINEFAKKIRCFNKYDAVLTGVETRSSSPVRILRDETLQSNVKGVFPCGEGAGYAGGIMSASVDGIKCGEAVIKSFNGDF